jgi:hypothetical protein
MTSYGSIAKQLCINKLNLSHDLLNEIKSYCFYDIKTWELINFIKHKKQRICHLFKNATISRANPYDLYVHDENTDQQWVFWTFDEDDGPNHQIQSYNCKYCGNYKLVSNENYINKIICQCNDYDDLPDLISINSENPDEFDDFDTIFDDDSIGV